MNEGAIERSIWVSSGLNDYLNFPGVGQVFAIRRETREVKSGKRRCETAYGVTSLTPEAAWNASSPSIEDDRGDAPHTRMGIAAASAPGTVRRT